MTKHYNESYAVKLNYQKEDGYWVVGHIEYITIRINKGKREKDNHIEAEKLAKAKYPGCHIVNVTFQ